MNKRSNLVNDPVLFKLYEIFVATVQQNIHPNYSPNAERNAEIWQFSPKFDTIANVDGFQNYPQSAPNQHIDTDTIRESVGEQDVSRTIYDFFSRLKQLKINDPQIIYGKGSLVKRIWIPFKDPHIDLLTAMLSFFPECKSLKFCHHDHGKVETSSAFYTRIPILGQLETLSFDDIESDGWVQLLNELKQNGRNIRSLTLEACPEKDPFDSKVPMGNVFPYLPNLEALRLDGVPLGTNYFGWGGDRVVNTMSQYCFNLRSISIDFADITMAAFYTIWNNCPLLEFLGLAAVGTGNSKRHSLQLNKHLRVLRLVDCHASDEIVYLILI